MLKRFRFLVAVNLVTALFISTLIFSNSAPIKACPPPVPSTLLDLYLQSDFIFVADFMDQKDGKVLLDEKDYYNIEIIRNLKISKVLKGKPPKIFSYTESEYRDKNEVKSDSEYADVREIKYFRYGYKGYSKLEVGEKYLFFFKKNPESNDYFLTDWISGFKKLSDADLFIYEKRIKELKAIVANKENQLEEVTKWLIRLIEEPATRWDGVYDLANSFERLEYEEENEETEERKEFVIDEEFGSSKPEIARHLSDSQKQYISSIAFSLTYKEMSDGGFGDYYYNLSSLIKHWDKSRLAIYAFGLFQTADKSDPVKTNAMLEFISSVLDDEKLYDIVNEYPVKDSLKQDEENAEEINDESENVVENSVESAAETEQIEKVEKSSEIEQKAEKLTIAQKRDKILQDFTNRYEHLLARGFPVEVEPEEDEVAEN